MATGNTAFGTTGLLATTINHFVKKLEEQSFRRNVLTAILSEGGISSQHGNKIIQPLLYGEVAAAGSFSDTDVFAAPDRSGITAAEFEFRQYYASIMISGIEMAKNSGPEAQLSLLKARLRQADLTISKNVNAMLFSDGSGNGGKDFQGLEAVIDNNNVFGGIDSNDSGNAWWRSSVTALGGALSLAAMRTKYNDVMDGSEKVTHILTTQNGFEAYEALLEDTVRHESTKLGDMGFDNLMFKSAPVSFDKGSTAGNMYFINKNYLELVSLDGKWFDVSEWLQPTNQDVFYKNILLYGNLTCSNRERQGVIRTISNA
jgi:hypothetical protein